jgi:hypothetical protein
MCLVEIYQILQTTRLLPVTALLQFGQANEEGFVLIFCAVPSNDNQKCDIVTDVDIA